jgi:hypothetical protein
MANPPIAEFRVKKLQDAGSRKSRDLLHSLVEHIHPRRA